MISLIYQAIQFSKNKIHSRTYTIFKEKILINDTFKADNDFNTNLFSNTPQN